MRYDKQGNIFRAITLLVEDKLQLKRTKSDGQK